MTQLAYEAQESWLPTVTGMTCNAMLIDEDSLLIHFGPPRVEGEDTVDARRTITLHGVWRVEQGDNVIAGSGDIDQNAIPETVRQLVGATLERVEVDHPGFDLALHFNGGLTIRCFPCDSTQFAAEFPEDDDDHLPVSWWVEGDDVPSDWEAFHDA